MRSSRLVGGLLLAVVVQAGMSFLASASGVPARMAIHWGPTGEADGFAPSGIALALTPVLTLLVGALLVAAPRLDRRVRGDAETSRVYDGIILGFLTFFTSLHALVAFQGDVGRILPGVIGVGTVLLGRAFKGIRPNGIMGFRTPWTLASDRAWDRTHAALGTWWTWGGGATVLASFVHPAAGVGVLLLSLLGSTLALALASRRWWAEDPDRRPV